ncbi:MAG: hydroxymethylbilane synthase [candidate division Zixibacteria bacterium]|nr:hydroxymethylbilane synthase [candidate division Zixibacteria bacterium]
MNSTFSKLRIGSRGSKLALIQSQKVVSALKAVADKIEVKIVEIKTEGDRTQTESLQQIGGAGVFVKAIEQALLQGEIDLAVHSAKDLPSELDPNLTITSVLRRESPRDVFISKNNSLLNEMPDSAVIGSGSPRRIAQLLYHYPRLQFKDIRGNIETRLRKLDEGLYDGIVLAEAGITRLNLSHRITQIIPLDICMPAPGQGIICIEALKSNRQLIELLKEINHGVSYSELSAERAFLRILKVGCSQPVAALARCMDGEMEIAGRIMNPKGKEIAQKKLIGEITRAEEIGEELGRLLKPSADKLLGSQ